MKNDIDSILNSMFRDGRLQMKSPAAKEAEKAVDAVQNAQLDMAASLQESIARMTKEAQADMEDLQRHLKLDGVEGPAGNGGNAQDLDAAFEVARQETLAQVLGQETFVNGLVLAFKRPFVAGTHGDAPWCRAALLGKPGTGRRSAVRAMAASLGRQGVLKTPKVTEVDLAAYGAPGSEKLFVQDLYAALKGGASALVFTRYEKCHPSVLPMVAALFSSGSVPLPGRYAEQKGLLVEVGTALAPGAVSKLPAGGRYLFLLGGEQEARLVGALGGEVAAGLDDLLCTGEFTQESLCHIAGAALKDLCLRTEKQLGCRLSYGQPEVEVLASAYNREQGAAAIGGAAQTLYKALSEEKLRKGLRAPLTAQLKAGDGALAIDYQGGNVSGRVEPPAKSGVGNQAEIEAVKEELADIVGLASVKDYILSLEDNFLIQQLRRQRGLKAEAPSMHMIFTGNPGTGKTTVARIVSRYLKAIGVLGGGQLVEVTRADLVGQYVGHTAPLTQKAIQSALGGVLFIDEAYALYRGRDDSFGLEAIDTLVKGMEDNRDRLVVILAGYSREMEEFLTANSGLRSRFPNVIEFPDYSAQELLDITKSIVAGMGYRLDPGCDQPLLGYYEAMQLTGDPRVNGNGRMARNRVEAAVIACSRRNVKTPEDQRDLELLLPADFGF
ncbi:AAA family ATPase [Acutalibacter caecimuris]|uniref:AAA family ATPase n=1 Tax=Acutalibacter caecimuris TaxID=3093657 RepID=UPI002AC9BB06|nr:AAA family ATPase [Acutalibacter sp. M00118]